MSQQMVEVSPPPAAAGLPPEQQVVQFVAGMWAGQCVYLAAKLGLADLVAGGPKSAAELAEATGAHPPSVYRLMRALASVGVFAEDEAGRFSLTPTADLLRTDSPRSLRWFVLSELSPPFVQAWGEALHSVQTGEPASTKAFGTDTWTYFRQNAEIGELFNRSMTSLTGAIEQAILKAYDFSGIRTLVDVGGGHGSLLAGILRQYPAMRGVVFDQPNVIDGAVRLLPEHGLGDRLQAVGGSFFESVPAGGDAYVMKFILHDWNDADSARILGSCHRAMRPGGRLLLVETVVPAGNGPAFGKLMDVHMMVMTGGRERTEAEWRALLDAAGFRLTRVVPTESAVSVIEAERV